MARRIDRHSLAQLVTASRGATSDFDLNADIAPPRGAPLRKAGVLVPVIERDGQAMLVLTKRASHLRHHPGQIAFPGGRMDEGDETVTDAALREAHEEIALDPKLVDVIGLLPTHETVTSYEMHPVLGWIRDDFDAVAEPGEVGEIFAVPMQHVLDPARYSIQSRHWKGQDRRFFTVPYGPYYIWGATARVLRAMAQAWQEVV
ncbi:CoA pyrophosphatase [Celeribacter arenosi]|uniref:CoA pyrophosphatase n=1 Tax=Celeribacter arenosi TaxID=792649 RepID=A0ABP7JXA4_9RHOB